MEVAMTEEHADETMVASMRADAERQGADDRKVTDAPHYLRTVLGCHQVFAFEDVEEKLLRLAALFGLDVL